MQSTTITSQHGYAIPVIYQLPVAARRLVLLCHGFGSAKDSPTALALAAELEQRGLGMLAFDFPAHGQSPVDGEQMRIGNCLDDLAAAEDLAAQLAPGAEICYFGSSFGAYIVALYLGRRPHRGQRAVLRCAAVTMPQLFLEDQDPLYMAQLAEQGFFTMEEYDRPLKITQGFMNDMREFDAFASCQPGQARLLMIHGDADTVAPLEAARRYATQAGAEFLVIPGAGHRFQGEGQTEQLVAAAADFFNQED